MSKEAASILVRSMSDCSTSELLRSAVENLALADATVVSAVANAIDLGGLSECVVVPDRVPYAPDLPPLVLLGLLSAFELARRAYSPAPPATVKRTEDAMAIAARHLGGRSRECILIIICDSADHVISTEIVSRGAVDHALLPIREVITAVLRADGRAFAVAHNHPAGVAVDSAADSVATERLAAAAREVGLRFLGHVFVTPRPPGRCHTEPKT